MPRRCLYDNAKVVTLGRDEEGRTEWNQRMLGFAQRLGFESASLCQPYRAQTKGKVESGVKYVRGNLWPSVRFTDDADLNRQALQWCDGIANRQALQWRDGIANRRTHGTTHRCPGTCWLRSSLTWGSAARHAQCDFGEAPSGHRRSGAEGPLFRPGPAP